MCNWLTAPTPTPALRGLGSRRGLRTVPGSREHPLYASCYYPLLLLLPSCVRVMKTGGAATKVAL